MLSNDSAPQSRPPQGRAGSRSRTKATLKDVAAQAGVSVTTASYVVNDKSEEMRISPDAQARVHAAVIDLAYRPNHHARSLRTSKTATIGLISDHLAGGRFSSQMLNGASAAASAAGHLLLIGETEGDRDLERRLIGEMIERDVDGIIYATVAARRITVPTPLRGHNAVLLNCFDSAGLLPAVLPDDLSGGRIAARALLATGAGTTSVVVGFDHDASAVAGERRVQGIREEYQAAGVPPPAIIAADWAVEPAYQAVRRHLDDGGRPTGVICLNDRIAMGATQALSAAGLRIPEQVAVVSFDGSELATWLRPTVASVRLPFIEMGATAVRLLIPGQSIPGQSKATGTTLIPVSLQAGDSLPG